VTLSYRRSWDGELSDALSARRAEDLRRQITTVGPHRDELDISVGPWSGPHPRVAGRATLRRSGLAPGHARITSSRRSGTPVLPRSTMCSPNSTLVVRPASSINYRSARLLLTTAVDPPHRCRRIALWRLFFGQVVERGGMT